MYALNTEELLFIRRKLLEEIDKHLAVRHGHAYDLLVETYGPPQKTLRSFGAKIESANSCTYKNIMIRWKKVGPETLSLTPVGSLIFGSSKKIYKEIAAKLKESSIQHRADLHNGLVYFKVESTLAKVNEIISQVTDKAGSLIAVEEAGNIIRVGVKVAFLD